jgi:hypothetical protein
MDHMAEGATRSPLQYLDKASNALRDMGLMPERRTARRPSMRYWKRYPTYTKTRLP